jgi:hypothetical protein
MYTVGLKLYHNDGVHFCIIKKIKPDNNYEVDWYRLPNTFYYTVDVPKINLMMMCKKLNYLPAWF